MKHEIIFDEAKERECLRNLQKQKMEPGCGFVVCLKELSFLGKSVYLSVKMQIRKKSNLDGNVNLQKLDFIYFQEISLDKSIFVTKKSIKKMNQNEPRLLDFLVRGKRE